MKVYQKNALRHLVFPVGGIGTGSIGISGNGRLVDPEINNHPYRGHDCHFSNFAIKAIRNDGRVDSRLLNGEYDGDVLGDTRDMFDYGGPKLSGFRHFRDAVCTQQFPLGKIDLHDETFPAKVSLSFFNPFIPSNDRDSSIPAAFFDIAVTNTSDEEMSFVLLESFSNLLEGFRTGNTYEEIGNCKLLTMHSVDEKDKKAYGELAIATDSDNTHHQNYWYRGSNFDTLNMFIRDLESKGEVKEREYPFLPDPEEAGPPDTATLTAGFTLKPGETQNRRFLICWRIPKTVLKIFDGDEPSLYEPYYAQVFGSAKDIVRYCFENWNRLYHQTKLFADALHGSDLPEDILDAVTANLSTLKSTTCLRIRDGSFWAFEGIFREVGSCAGMCNHVWNYAYALPFLFPKLAKGISNNRFRHAMKENGMMFHRMRLEPAQTKSLTWQVVCFDGQMGDILAAYREWKISGDGAWLFSIWENIKKCISYAWSEDNVNRWDPEKSGVISGQQFHTLDMFLFGVNAWLTGLYHAALEACAEMAEFAKDHTFAKLCLDIAERGKEKLKQTFNGEYFVQQFDRKNKAFLEPFSAVHDRPLYDGEMGEISYQLGDACGIDQVLADYHTALCGLAPVFDPHQRKKALESIYRFNFLSMEDMHNPCRVFALNREKGVRMFAWPGNAEKPQIPILYADETMTGFEYAVADNMLGVGMEAEALEIVAAVRARYDGSRRNPLSELECGSSYARAMASYSFLLTYSGFVYDLSEKKLGFKPLRNGCFFWSIDGAWGKVSCEDKQVAFTVLYGEVCLKQFVLYLEKVKEVYLNGKPCDFVQCGDTVTLTATLKANGEILFKEQF